jgi:glutamate racemase
MVGERVAVVDSAQACAEDVARRLGAAGLLRGDRGESGALRCFVTDNTPRFSGLAQKFLGMDVADPVLVSMEELYRAEALERGPAERRVA